MIPAILVIYQVFGIDAPFEFEFEVDTLLVRTQEDATRLTNPVREGVFKIEVLSTREVEVRFKDGRSWGNICHTLDGIEYIPHMYRVGEMREVT